MKFFALSLFAALSISFAACSQTNEGIARAADAAVTDIGMIEGDFSGYLQIPDGPRLLLVFHISSDRKGNYSLTMDSPDQGMAGMAGENVRLEGDRFLAEFPAIGATLTVKVSHEEPYDAVFFQGMPFEISLKSGVVSPERSRPQEPTERAYIVEAVTFPGGGDGVRLAGELTLPRTQEAVPGIILISGSGPQDRDETFMGHKPFLVLSDYLTQQGYAVLRYDDRGFGESSGNHDTATTEEFAKDAAAALSFMGSDDRIVPEKIVLMGHSEGGLIAPLAAQISEPAALVLLAAPSRPLRNVLIQQSRDFSRAEGLPENVVNMRAELNEALLNTMREHDTGEDARAAAIDLLVDAGMPEAQAVQQAENIGSPWLSWVIDYDPAPALAAFDGPVFALYGTKDVQVSSAQNADGMLAALQHEKSNVQIFENHNHLFQLAETGAMSEYIEIENTMEPEVLEAIGNWLEDIF